MCTGNLLPRESWATNQCHWQSEKAIMLTSPNPAESFHSTDKTMDQCFYLFLFSCPICPPCAPLLTICLSNIFYPLSRFSSLPYISDTQATRLHGPIWQSESVLLSADPEKTNLS